MSGKIGTPSCRLVAGERGGSAPLAYSSAAGAGRSRSAWSTSIAWVFSLAGRDRRGRSRRVSFGSRRRSRSRWKAGAAFQLRSVRAVTPSSAATACCVIPWPSSFAAPLLFSSSLLSAAALVGELLLGPRPHLLAAPARRDAALACGSLSSGAGAGRSLERGALTEPLAHLGGGQPIPAAADATAGEAAVQARHRCRRDSRRLGARRVRRPQGHIVTADFGVRR